MITQIFLSFILLLSTSTFAQTKASAHSKTAFTQKKQQVKVIASVTQKKESLLETELNEAKSDYERVTELLKAEIKKGEGFEICTVNGLTVQQENDDWFIKHFQYFEEASQKVDAVIASANAKLAILKDQPIQVVPVNLQTTDKIEISLSKMISYFKLVNGRLKTCRKEDRNAVLDDLENHPDHNDFNLAHSQVIAAMQVMTTNINASLRDPEATYTIAFTPSSCGYNLELQVSLMVNGTKQKFDFSLLNSAVTDGSKVELSDEAKWIELTKNHTQIDRLPLDAIFRYRIFQEKERGRCNRESLPLIASFPGSVPYLTFSELTKFIAESKSNGKMNSILGMDFVQIEPGEFEMGSDSGEAYRLANEVHHQVKISREFEMQTTPVTQKQWYEVMSIDDPKYLNPATFKNRENCSAETYSDRGGGMCENNPVETISWIDICGKTNICGETPSFIKKLNEQKDGYAYRLPTEAEWEYAARGGSTANNEGALNEVYGVNANELGDYAWDLSNSNPANQSHEVAMKKGDALGLYDMHGNVWTWTNDWFAAYPVGPQTDPAGPVYSPDSYETRVIRGGCYANNPEILRAAYRGVAFPSTTSSAFGFRLVRTKI